MNIVVCNAYDDGVANLLKNPNGGSDECYNNLLQKVAKSQIMKLVINVNGRHKRLICYKP
jgi:hypothetical protein